MKLSNLKQNDSVVVNNYNELKLLERYFDKLGCKWCTGESYLNNMKCSKAELEKDGYHHYYINKGTHGRSRNHDGHSYDFTQIDFGIDNISEKKLQIDNDGLISVSEIDNEKFKMYDRVTINEYDGQIQKGIIVHKHPSFDDKYVVEVIGESPYGHYDIPLAYISKGSGRYGFINTKDIKIDTQQELQSYDGICAGLSVPLIDYGLSFSDCGVSSGAYSAVTGVSGTAKDCIDVEYVQSKYGIDLYPDIGEIIPKIKSNSRYPKNPYIY